MAWATQVAAMIETQVLVVGAGPAGLGAASAAARAGARVLLVDENDRPGGQLFKQIHRFFGSQAHHAGLRGFQIGSMLLEECRTAGVRTMLDTRAVGILDDGSVALDCQDHLETVRAQRIVLATGARENALAFDGWTKPGVMTAGAAQTFCNVHGTLPGQEVLIVGSGNVGLIVAYQLWQAGARIAAIVEAMPAVTGYHVHAAKVRRAGVEILLSHTVTEARGDGRVEEAVLSPAARTGQPGAGPVQTRRTDLILLAVGLSPRCELAGMAGCRLTWEPLLGGHLPCHDRTMRSTRPGVFVCGDLAGVEEASTALDEGRLAGLSAARELGLETAETAAWAAELEGSLCSLRSGSFGSPRAECKERIVGRWAW